MAQCLCSQTNEVETNASNAINDVLHGLPLQAFRNHGFTCNLISRLVYWFALMDAYQSQAN